MHGHGNEKRLAPKRPHSTSTRMIPCSENERQLQAAHSINQGLFETSLDLILVVDRQGTFIRISPSSQAILGYHPDEMVGHSAATFLYPDDLHNTRNEMRLARRGQVTRNFECRYVHKAGRVVTLTWTGIWSEPNQQHFFIGRDMTERIKLEQQLRQAQKMEAVGQLTGGIAHDFNNILGVIIGMTELLAAKTSGDPNLGPLTKAIDEAAERGAVLVKRMLAFARKQPLQTHTLCLNETVQRTATMLERTLGEDIVLQTVLADDLWLAEADPFQLEDSLVNLAVNARHAMPRGGRLVFETANVQLDEAYAAQNAEVSPGEYVTIMVTDSGTGMPPEVIERAFEPFFTTKDVGQGTGLGLSMVYGFIKQSRGHVKIYSEVGHGTSIKLYLPRTATGAAEATVAPTLAPLTQPARNETILVVEDDAAVRAMAVHILQDLGYRVQQAANGKIALDILREVARIDLLFTDMIMPDMRGVELVRKARQERPHLKALFTSGYSEQFIRAQGDSDVQLLGKPYRKEQLAAAIRNALDAS